ncbi:MAG: ATP-binding protein [Gammaproteobacteria bacterium]|nr:ATP-binding protein [Gammaproteobacteria bacterium]
MKTLEVKIWIPPTIVILLLLTITYLFINSQPTNPKIHLHILQSLHILEHLEPNLNRDLLLAREGLLNNYDRLGHTIKNMLNQLKIIKQLSTQVPKKLEHNITPTIKHLEKTLKKSIHIILDFQVIAQLKQKLTLNLLNKLKKISVNPNRSNDNIKIINLLNNLFGFLLTHKKSDLDSAHEQLQLLRENNNQNNQKIIKQSDNLLQQIKNINNHINKIDSLAISASLDILENTYIYDNNNINSAAYTYRSLLYLTSLGLLAYLLLLLLQLRYGSIKIKEINKSLALEINERKSAEKSQRIYMDQLKQSNKELDDFTYIASHDLKDPLRGINNYATFLIEDCHEKLNHENRKNLESIKRLSQRMSQLIEDLRDCSRVDYMELAFGVHDLYSPLNEVLEALEYNIDENNISIQVPQRLPIIHCDRIRIKEIFHNLVTNAIKYNDKSLKWIEIGCKFYSEKQHKRYQQRQCVEGTVFYVKDNGIGIQKNHWNSVYQIFKRLHGREQYGGGTGVGLTIVKKLVQRHQGKIWIESTLNEGTTFYFTLDKMEPEAKKKALLEG